MRKPEAVEFSAILAETGSWLKKARGGGVRLMLDVPESDLAQVLKLVMWEEASLKVRIERLP